MAEKIYAIPVNDAFDRDCECPVCLMYNDLESDAIGFTLGPSYMDDRFRLQTDELGFCKNHLKMLYDRNNRLGLALMIKTHTDKTNKEIEAISKSPLKGGFFKKGNQALIDYLDSLSRTCFVCDRINALYDKYIYTVIYLYKTDPAFKKKYENCKGFCNEHLKLLLKCAGIELSGRTLDEFNKTTISLYLENMKRINGEIEWFINKFDYKYKDEPWKNSKDSIPRAMIKLRGILPEEENKVHKHYD